MRPRKETAGHGPERAGALDKRQLLSMSAGCGSRPRPRVLAWFVTGVEARDTCRMDGCWVT